VTTAEARARGVRITSLPRHVAQGGIEHLDAAVIGSVGCSLTVKYANGRTQSLGQKPVRAQRVAWTWRVPRTAAPGRAIARVSCKGLATTSGNFGAFFVKRRLAPARVVVTKSGLTQVADQFGSGTTISYGLVLVNRSRNVDARDVEIDVNLLDAKGNAVAADKDFLLGGIPAGATYYFGNQVGTNDATTVTRVAAVIKVGHSAPRSLVAPVVTNLRLSADQFDGSAVVDGDVTNEGTKDLSQFAEIDAVFFNSAGNVVGGDAIGPPFSLPPGAQTAFEIDTGPGGPQASGVSQVKVSMDPDYGTF